MGATGAMAPTNFPRDAFDTHEICKYMYMAPARLTDWHP